MQLDNGLWVVRKSQEDFLKMMIDWWLDETMNSS